MSSTNNLKSYGCVECQLRHYSFQDIYQEHIMLQSRHGLEDVSNEEAALALFPTRSAATLLEQNTELLEALRLMCGGIERSHNDNVVGASMRASVPTLRAIIAKCEAQIPA